MTPERKKYLAKCSQKEKRLHKMIKKAKNDLGVCKEELKLVPGLPLLKWRVKHAKTVLTAYRHELQRLKGMDRVVVPKVSYIGSGDSLVKIEHCTCGECLMRELCCPNCGRRILWR